MDFETVLEHFGIQHVYATAYKPSSNGAVERLNRTVIQLLRCSLQQHGTQWDVELGPVIMSYNSTMHTQLLWLPEGDI